MPAQAQNFTARFYLHSTLDGDATLEKGENVYKDVVFIEIRAKGDKNTSFSRPMTESDKGEFPVSWGEYSSQHVDIEDGTSLQHLPGVGPSLLIELKKHGITTIEDIAGITDANAFNIQGALNLKHKAVAYLAAMNAPVVEKPKLVVVDDPVDVVEATNDPGTVPKISLETFNRAELQAFLKANGQKFGGRSSDATLLKMAKEFI